MTVPCMLKSRSHHAVKSSKIPTHVFFLPPSDAFSRRCKQRVCEIANEWFKVKIPKIILAQHHTHTALMVDKGMYRSCATNTRLFHILCAEGFNRSYRVLPNRRKCEFLSWAPRPDSDFHWIQENLRLNVKKLTHPDPKKHFLPGNTL